MKPRAPDHRTASSRATTGKRRLDEAKQIIVAHGLDAEHERLYPQLVPLVDAVRANLGRKPREISADAGLLQ